MMLKKIPAVLLSALLLTGYACGPSQEEIRAREKARQDSLAQVEAQRLAKAEAERIANEQREAEERRLAEIEAEKERRRLEYDVNGKFTVQIEASRALSTAERELALWKKRGYTDAFIVKFGDEETGDVWFRIRLGKFATRQMAEKAAGLVFEDFKRKTWVTRVQ